MRKNETFQEGLQVFVAISAVILLVVMVATMYYERPWASPIFKIFTEHTAPFHFLSVLAVLSVFLVNLSRHWKTFIPLYLLNIIGILGNIPYLLSAGTLIERILG